MSDDDKEIYKIVSGCRLGYLADVEALAYLNALIDKHSNEARIKDTEMWLTAAEHSKEKVVPIIKIELHLAELKAKRGDLE